MATDGTLEKLRYAGTQVSLCLRKSLKRSDSIFYKGVVRGLPAAPFARQGDGWMLFPARPRAERPSSILKGQWLHDEITCTDVPLLALVNGRIDPSQVLLRNATECRACLSVFDASKSHVCQSDRRNPDSAHRRPHLTSAPRPASEDTSTSTPSPRREGTSQSEPGVSEPDFNDICHLVGFRDGVASAFVLQRLSFVDGRRLGGGKGARSFAAYDSQNLGRSVCFAAACRSTISCSTRDTCPHIEAVREAFNAKGIRVTGGLTLDGFLALSSEEPEFLQPRRCTADYCVTKTEEQQQRRKKKDEDATPAGRTEQSEQGKRAHAADHGDGVSEDTEGGHTGSLSEDSDHERGSDTEASEASTATTRHISIAYGYIPKIAEIVAMTRSQLRVVSDELSLDTETTTENLKYNLAEYFHPNDLAILPKELHRHHEASLKGGVNKRRSRKRKKTRATAGVVGREPDADAAARDQAFKYAQRARRCVRGSMCTEHALQKRLAVRLQERIESAEDEDNLPDIPNDDANVEVGTNRAEADDTSALHDASSKRDDNTRQDAMAWARPRRATSPASACSCSDEKCMADSAFGPTPAAPTTSRSANVPPHGEVVDAGETAFHTSSGSLSAAGRPSRAAADKARKQPTFLAEILPARTIESMHIAGGEECCACSASPASKKGEVPSGTDREVPISAKTGNTHTRLYLTPTQAEDFLYAITLAKDNATQPVIPIAKNLYAVLRTQPDECSYSCPGGYSLVKAELRADPLRPEEGGTILSLGCTCSEYRSCRSGMGGRSKKGSKKFCTCCLMVVAANVLDAPLELLRQGDSAWLLASRRHEQVSSQIHNVSYKHDTQNTLASAPTHTRALAHFLHRRYWGTDVLSLSPSPNPSRAMHRRHSCPCTSAQALWCGFRHSPTVWHTVVAVATCLVHRGRGLRCGRR